MQTLFLLKLVCLVAIVPFLGAYAGDLVMDSSIKTVAAATLSCSEEADKTLNCIFGADQNSTIEILCDGQAYKCKGLNEGNAVMEMSEATEQSLVLEPIPKSMQFIYQ